ncbi:MAG: hypothetical protein D6775_11580 [Caldilineae bacterium]|nr:MAG: hypothetical protein D6775_11580 [Caldilineae bacterium]
MTHTKRLALLAIFFVLLAACSGSTPTPALPTPTPGPLAPVGVPRETYYAPFPVTITLDGDLSDWEGVPRVLIPEKAAQITGATSVSFAAAADDRNLYFLAVVTDPHIVTGKHGSDYWNEDSVEFYINATGDLSLTAYRDGVAQITIPPLNIGRTPEETLFGGVRHETAEPRAKVVETPDGYAIEAAVPLRTQVWDITPQHGGVLGFQVHLNGASEGNRNLKVIWSKFDTGDSSYYDPSVFGKLIFYEIGRPAPAEITPPTPVAEAVEPVPADALYKQADAPVADRVEDLLARMTLAEKIGQMTLVEKNSIRPDDIAPLGIGGLLSGGGGYPKSGNSPEKWAEMVDGFQQEALGSRLGIPLIYGVDAVHGHSNVRGATIFPHNIGLGATNDPDLMTEIGRATALEMAATGIYWNYAPGVMVPQDIRWGRTYEGYGERPELVSAMAVSYLQGLQAADLFPPNRVVGTPKHFVGDGGTRWGTGGSGYKIDQGVTDVDEATLRAVHLPPYQAAIAAGARTIMVSYSSWGGMKMHAQKYLITDVLKGELGFDGFVVSDWGAVDQITPDYYQAVVTAINAGIDMNMVPYDYRRFINTLTKAVETGDVSRERIDDAVRRILTVKFEMGLFEQPFSRPDLLPLVGSDEHRALARRAVAESLVLLKNEGGLLPLSPDIGHVYVGGSAADDIGIQSGGWTIEWQGKKGDITPGTTILQGIQQVVGPGTTVEYSRAGRFQGDASAADAVCIAVVGELPYAEGKGDSDRLSLPPGELRILRRMEDSCANLAVVLVSGRPLLIADHLPRWDALVAAWLPGSEGAGVADVLFGDAPFRGKTPVTWPVSADQLPLGASDQPPLFPFGFGLTP